VLKLDEFIYTLHALSGPIFKKAELTNNFKQTYSQVFERIMEIEIAGRSMLEVFGSVGG
jgi:hypothetical protein